MQRVNDILNHPEQKEIEERLKILDFFDEYGAQATGKAFGKSRSTIYLGRVSLSHQAASSPPWRRETGLPTISARGW